jgi:hypothetical protein
MKGERPRGAVLGTQNESRTEPLAVFYDTDDKDKTMGNASFIEIKNY